MPIGFFVLTVVCLSDSIIASKCAFLVTFNLLCYVGWEVPYDFTDPYFSCFTQSKLKYFKHFVTFPVGSEKSRGNVVCTSGVQRCMANQRSQLPGSDTRS